MALVFTITVNCSTKLSYDEGLMGQGADTLTIYTGVLSLSGLVDILTLGGYTYAWVFK